MASDTEGSRTKRTAIITGGSRGMGRDTAINLARRSVDIIFPYLSNQADAESLIREIEELGGKAAASRLDWRMFARRSKTGEATGLTTL